MLAGWTRRAKELKQEVYALYFACRDPGTPRSADLGPGQRRCARLAASLAGSM